MNKLIKLSSNFLFKTFIGDRGLRVYKKEVDKRLGMPGLTKLVIEATGQELNPEEAYCFCIKNQNTIKILTRDQQSASMIAVYDEDAKGIKEEIRLLALM